LSGEKDNIRFDLRRGREHHIRCQERKITSDSMSGEEDKMIFHVNKGRGRSNDIPCQESKIQSYLISGEEDRMRFHVKTGRGR
jgi:hypothetical protein